MHLHLTLLALCVAASLRTAHVATLRQYDRDWLMNDADSAAAAPRRITAKSVFVAPSNVRCSPGWRANADGRCERVVTVRQEAQIQFLSQKLSALFGSFPGAQKVVIEEVATEASTTEHVNATTESENLTTESENSTTETENSASTSSGSPVEDVTPILSEEENVASEVVDYETTGDGPMEVDFFIVPDLESSTEYPKINKYSNENMYSVVASTQNVYILSEYESTTMVSKSEVVSEIEANSTEVPTSTEESTYQEEDSTERVEVIMVESKPSRLIKDVSHGVDSVQVVEEDLEASTEESVETATPVATTSVEESTSQTSTSDLPEGTTYSETTDVVVVESETIGPVSEDRINMNVKNVGRPSLIGNQDTTSQGVTENVEIVYAQGQNTKSAPTKPLIIDLKPSEQDFGIHLQNHNLNPSKLVPPFLENPLSSPNKFPDYPFGLDEIRRPPPQRPLGGDFHHRDGFVRFPGDERVNVVKFPHDHSYPGDKYNNWGGGGWRIDTRRGRPPPPPMGLWSKMGQPTRQRPFDRRRPQPNFQ